MELKKKGKYEITLMRDIFGVYLCRFWLGYTYKEHQSKNKFTAYKEALKKIKALG